jgi:hypothetical protein
MSEDTFKLASAHASAPLARLLRCPVLPSLPAPLSQQQLWLATTVVPSCSCARSVTSSGSRVSRLKVGGSRCDGAALAVTGTVAELAASPVRSGGSCVDGVGVGSSIGERVYNLRVPTRNDSDFKALENGSALAVTAGVAVTDLLTAIPRLPVSASSSDLIASGELEQGESTVPSTVSIEQLDFAESERSFKLSSIRRQLTFLGRRPPCCAETYN